MSEDDAFLYAYSSRALYGTYHYQTAYIDFLEWFGRIPNVFKPIKTATDYMATLYKHLPIWISSLTTKQYSDIKSTFRQELHPLCSVLKPNAKTDRQYSYLIMSDCIYRDKQITEYRQSDYVYSD